MTHSDAIDALAAALAAAQGEYPAIPRDTTVKIRTKSGGEYTFQYAPLDTILQALRPVLAKHGLAVMQDIEGGAVSTTILHTSGQWWNGAQVLIPPDEPGPKPIGSALTYASRYSLRAALMIATDDDDDATTASGDHMAVKASQSPQDASKPPQASTRPESARPVNAEGSHVNAGDRTDKGSAVLEGRISTDPYTTTIQVKGSPCEVARFDLIVDNETLSVTAWHDARDEAMQYHAGDEVEVTGTWNHYRDRWNVNAAAVRDRLPF